MTSKNPLLFIKHQQTHLPRLMGIIHFDSHSFQPFTLESPMKSSPNFLKLKFVIFHLSYQIVLVLNKITNSFSDVSSIGYV